jgi:hypothetical protein
VQSCIIEGAENAQKQEGGGIINPAVEVSPFSSSSGRLFKVLSRKARGRGEDMSDRKIGIKVKKDNTADLLLSKTSY